MSLPQEYVELLTAVVNCVAADSQPPLRTAAEITAWLHDVTAHDVREALNGGSNERLKRGVRCVIEQTHDSRLQDWTPEEIADWCQRTRLEHVHAALEQRSSA